MKVSIGADGIAKDLQPATVVAVASATTDVAAVAAACTLTGWSFGENAGTAAVAELYIRDGTDATGTIVAHITLNPDESIRENAPTPGIKIVTGIYIDRVSRNSAASGYQGILVSHALGWYQSMTGTTWGMFLDAEVLSTGAIVGTPPPWILSTVARANNDVDLCTNGSSFVNRTNAASVQARGATRLGGDPSGVQFMSGSLCEVIWYDRAVSTGERKAVEEYLYRRFAEPPSYALGTV